MRPVLPILLLLPLLAPLASAQEGPTEVEVGILVINFGNYDTNKGTYVLDFYLFFRWDPVATPANFTPAAFEFMNGRASAKDKIFDAIENDKRELWYRIQANLYSEPHFENYPYDTQIVEILFEDSLLVREQLVYVPLQDESGLDEGFRAPGWRVSEPAFTVVTKSYKFGEDYSRAKFSIELSRERFSTSLKSMLPPVAFVLVAALAFFLHPSKWGNRIGLGTGMLISSVMFHISQTVSLPPLPGLILFDKVMIAVYLFVLASLAVTALIAIDEDFWKDRDFTKQINVWGAFLAVAVPLIVLLAMLLL